MYQMMLLLIPLLIVLALLAEFVLGPVLYGFYQKDVTVEKGAAGSEAAPKSRWRSPWRIWSGWRPLP